MVSTSANESTREVHERRSGIYEQGSTNIAKTRHNQMGEQRAEGEMVVQVAEPIHDTGQRCNTNEQQEQATANDGLHQHQDDDVDDNPANIFA